MSDNIKTYTKNQVRLKEEVEKNYAGDTSGVNSSPSDIVNKTKSEHPDATAVTVPGNEIDGNGSTQTPTIETDNTPQGLQNAQRLTRASSQQGVNPNVKINLNNGVEYDGEPLTEIKFTKRELAKYLLSL